MELERSPTRAEIERELARVKNAPRRLNSIYDTSPSSRISYVNPDLDSDWRRSIEKNIERIMQHLQILVVTLLKEASAKSNSSSESNGTETSRLPDHIEESIARTMQGLHQAGECESQPEDLSKAEDVPATGDPKESHPPQIASNPAGGILESGTVTAEESEGRATIVYSTRNLRASKPAKEDTRAQKKMRLTEVEKLKKDHDDIKSQRALRGSKEKVEKSRSANIDNQTYAKGKMKRNMSAPVVQETEDPEIKKGDPVGLMKPAHIVQEGEELEFKKGDTVRLKGLEEGEEDKVVALGKVQNVAGASLHGRTIIPGTVSIEVVKSLDDDYKLFAQIDQYDPPVTLVGQAVGHFVLWPTEFMDIDVSLSAAV